MSILNLEDVIHSNKELCVCMSILNLEDVICLYVYFEFGRRDTQQKRARFSAHYNTLQHPALCCITLQRITADPVFRCGGMYAAVCCSVLHCFCSLLQSVAVCSSVFQCVAVFCSVLQFGAVYCVAVYCSAWWERDEGWDDFKSVHQCSAVGCSVLQYVAVHCSVVQRVALSCSV